MVLISVISNLLGKSTYKKYINLIAGIILVILVISPMLKLFQLEKTLDYYFTTNTLLAEAQDMSSLLQDMEDEQKSAIYKEYKEQIKAQVRNILEDEEIEIYDIQVTINEDSTSGNYGDILELTLMAGHKKEEEVTKETVRIDTVQIDKIKIEKQEGSGKREKNYLSPEEIHIKNKLSDFYNINPDNINISIQE